jgi:hypothetical protein
MPTPTHMEGILMVCPLLRRDAQHANPACKGHAAQLAAQAAHHPLWHKHKDVQGCKAAAESMLWRTSSTANKPVQIPMGGWLAGVQRTPVEGPACCSSSRTLHSSNASRP